MTSDTEKMFIEFSRLSCTICSCIQLNEHWISRIDFYLDQECEAAWSIVVKRYRRHQLASVIVYSEIDVISCQQMYTAV